MEPIKLDGIVYDKAYVEGLKQPLLAIRDCLLAQDKFEFAVAMTQVHVVLDHYCKNVKE